jgi:pimeloyl-ACP methyl ester carboxylesterase
MMSRFGEQLGAIAAKGLRVVAYDARGHGRSGYTTRRSDYAWAALGDDMHAFARALGIERISVYGGSMGAGTALMCALEHPEIIDKLILRSPPSLLGAALAPVSRQWGSIATLYRLFGPRWTARIILAMPAGKAAQARDPTFDMRRFWSSQRRASIVPAIRSKLVDDRLPVHRFGEIAPPALILTHPDDELHPLASGELLYERMPHAKLAVAPSATYWQENPDALTHVIASFVKGEPIAQGLPMKVAHEHESPEA